VLDVFGLVGAFGVLFGVASGTNAEVGIGGLEFANQFNGVMVVAVVAALFDEFRSQVAAESHHVLDAGGLHVFDALVHGVLAARNAGQVGEHRNAEFLLEVLGDIKGEVADAAACAVGNAHKRGTERGDRFGGGLYAFEASFFLGRENFKRKTHFVLLQNINDFHITS